MHRREVVYQTRRAGGGTVWVHRPRGGWRAITFTSGPGQLAKLFGLCGVLDRLGSATTQVVGGVLAVAQVTSGPAVPVALVPRAGPAACPITPHAP